MLFRKEIEKRCAWCTYAACITEDEMFCRRKGPVTASSSCRHFIYDPLKRVPPRSKSPDFKKYDERDFSL